MGYKVLKLLLISAIVLFISSCSTSDDISISKGESEQIAIELIKNSNEFRDNGGFDITLVSSNSLYNECKSCFEFDFTFGVLGEKIGYTMKVKVKNGEASFIDTPKSISK